MKAFTFGWSCPHHSCKICGRKAAAVGGLIFRCEMCPTAYCEDHLPNAARERITNKCKRFLHWVNIIRNKHVFCSVPRNVQIYYNMTKNGTDMDAMNRDSSSDSNNTEENTADAIEVLKRNNITRTQFAERIVQAVGSDLTVQTVKQYLSAYVVITL